MKVLPDLDQWAADQARDARLQDIISGNTESSLELGARQTANGSVYFDVAHDRTRLFVPQCHRRAVFNSLHHQAHGGGAATCRIIKARFVWPGMDREILRWVKTCEPCQRAKIHRHTTTPLTPLAPSDLDLVGPLPASNNVKYLLTCIDRFTRWPEAWPIDSMCAHTVASTLVTNWIARFGVPDIITTDQGRQFESGLMQALNTTFGIQHVRTSPYHPQANGLVERLHRTLKAALTAHESPHWSQHLPIVLLALRNTVKPDVAATPAELVYGMTLRLPGELFHAATQEANAPDFVVALRNSMTLLRPTPGTNHDSSRRVFVPTKLDTVSHVFVRVDAHHTPLQPRYEGPYAVLERRDKDFKLQLSSRTAWISVDRLKPTFVLRDDPLIDHSYAIQSIELHSASKISDEEDVLLLAAVMDDEEQKRHKRRKWVHEINSQRENLGEFNHLMPQLRNDAKRFFIYFRMTSNCFDEILNFINEDIRKETTHFRVPIPPPERLAIALR
ncbi:hypothetical protein QTP88_023970 [Uroleucon formosanum]